MAIQSYNPVVRAAGTTEQALERLRNLEIVDRFTGETLVDRTNDVYGTTANFITVSTGTPVATPGTYAIIGKTIFTEGVQTSATADGVHLQFFNCNIIHRPGATNGTSTQPFGTGQNLNSGDIDARVSEGAATTRSVSFYGCSFNIAPTAPANIFTQWSDAFNSTLTMVGLNIPLPCFNVGSRAINFTVLAESVANSVLELYGAPDLQEGLVIRNTSLEITGQGAGGTDDYQLLYTNPNFTGPGNLQRWRTQNSAIAQAAFQVIGPFNPFNNVLNDTVRTLSGDNSVQTYAHLRSGTGQILNYYGWSPSFFQDIAQTIPIQGVNARIRTTAALTNTTINGTGGEGSMNTAISNTPAGYADLSGAAKNTQSIFVSNAQGLLEANNSGTYTTDGSTFTAGWIDFLRLRPYNESGETTGGATLGQTWFDAVAPDNTIFAPISQIAGGVYGQYESDVEYRGYTHNLSVSDTQNGVIGTADGNQTSSTLSPIDESSFVGANIVGVSVKSQNVSAGQPSISFPADSHISINDVRDAYRAGWYDYTYGIAGGEHLTPAINLTLSNVHSTDYTATATDITVRGNGVSGTTGDLFTTDSLGTGDFGGGFLRDHVLTFSGAVTQLGDVTDATITAPSIALTSFSDSRRAIFSGDITGALSTSFVEDCTFGTGTITFTGLTENAEYSAEDLLGSDYSTTGTVTIASNNAIILATDDANVVGTGVVTKEIATIDYNVNVTIPTGSNGFLTVRNLGGNTNLQELTITNGVLSAPVNVITNKNSLNIGIFYKLNSTTGSSGTVYRTRLVTVNGNPGADVSVEPSVVNSVFTNGSQELSTYSIQFAASTGASIRGTFSATSAAVSENTSRAQGQGSIILATNQANYFNWVVLNEWAQDPVDYLTGEVLFNNDVADVPTGTTPFGTANGVILVSNTNDTQTIVHNFTGQLTNLVGGSTLYTGSGVRQVLNVPIGSATTATVANAVRDVVSTELLPVESNQERITENQRGLETAVRRGAVKAAAYSSENVKLTTDA